MEKLMEQKVIFFMIKDRKGDVKCLNIYMEKNCRKRSFCIIEIG